jgi:hypothetical protein
MITIEEGIGIAGFLAGLVGTGIYVGGYRQMVENQRLATARAFRRMKRHSYRLSRIEASLYSHKMLTQPTDVGDGEDDDDVADE